MNKVETLAKVIFFDPKTNVISHKLDFVDDSLLKEIENLLQYSYPIKVSFKTVKSFRSKTYKQQCQFWVDFEKVLSKQKIEKTAEVCETLYDNIKKTIFPCRKVLIGYDENNVPKFDYYSPNMGDLSIDEMARVIESFREKYSYLKIDWEKKE
jgi:hypothetical protein